MIEAKGMKQMNEILTFITTDKYKFICSFESPRKLPHSVYMLYTYKFHLDMIVFVETVRKVITLLFAYYWDHSGETWHNEGYTV